MGVISINISHMFYNFKKKWKAEKCPPGNLTVHVYLQLYRINIYSAGMSVMDNRENSRSIIWIMESGE
jgi:hypothetical protein